MSKIIKSERCVETHPCRLQPIDMDAFFIRDEEEKAEEIATETAHDEVAAAEELQDSHAENSAVEEAALETAVTEEVVVEEEAETEADLWSFPAQVRQNAIREADLTELSFEEKKAAPPKTEDFNLERLANVAETIDSLISGAQQQAGTIAEKARGEADHILQGASQRAGATLEEANKKAGATLEQANQKAGAALELARQKADELTFSAENKAGSILTQARQQSESILEMAKDQSALIVEGAKQQTEKMLEKGKKQAQVIVDNAKKEAASTIETAQKQAEETLQAANQESITIKENARQEGLQAGRAEAITAVRQELTANLNQALTLIEEIETARMQRLTSSEPELLKLAVNIAEKIIGAELKLEPIRQLEIVREALSKITITHMVTIRIHPEDMELVSQNLIILQEAFTEPKPIKIQEDPGIAKGSCFVETDHGNLDVRVKSQLDRVMTEILKVGQIQ